MEEAETRCKDCNEIIFPEEGQSYTDELCNECYERGLKDSPPTSANSNF